MAEAQFADTKLFDVTSTMTFTDPRLEVAARGRVEHLTTETMGVGGGTALDLNGTVDGTFVLDDVHAPFSLTGMSAGGVANLTTSTIAGLTIDQADVDASLAAGTLTLRKRRRDGNRRQGRRVRNDRVRRDGNVRARRDDGRR